MSSKRTLAIAIVAIVLLLVGLGTFALWLFGRGGDEVITGDVGPDVSDTGIVFVRAIDAYGDFRLTTPVGIGAGSDGGFFVTLRDQAKVVEYDAQGDYVQAWGERGLEAGQMMVPLGVAVDRAADRVYVTDRSRLRLICFDRTGALRWEVPVLNPLMPTVTPGGIVVTTFGPVVLFDAEGLLLGEFATPEDRVEPLLAALGAASEQIQKAKEQKGPGDLDELFARGDTWEAMKAAVNMGRDTDCLASVAAGLSGALSGGGSIPPELVRQVDHATSLNPFTNSKRTLRQTSSPPSSSSSSSPCRCRSTSGAPRPPRPNRRRPRFPIPTGTPRPPRARQVRRRSSRASGRR